MAIQVVSEIQGMTKEQYEQAIGQIGDQLRRAPGFNHHVAGPMEGGYRVVEIWDSREELDRWLQDTVMPMAQQVGIPPFEPKIFPIDNVLTR
jgi:heme-degrading monooxygenase HmoA